MSQGEQWPSLDFAQWKDTYKALHRWTQIVGKIRMRQTPWINHSWHVALYPSARGLTTSAMRHGRHALRHLQKKSYFLDEDEEANADTNRKG